MHLHLLLSLLSNLDFNEANIETNLRSAINKRKRKEVAIIKEKWKDKGVLSHLFARCAIINPS